MEPNETCAFIMKKLHSDQTSSPNKNTFQGRKRKWEKLSDTQLLVSNWDVFVCSLWHKAKDDIAELQLNSMIFSMSHRETEMMTNKIHRFDIKTLNP